MRLAGLVLMAASAVMLTGCSDLVSLNPFFTDKDSIADSSILGTWTGSDGDSLFIVQQADHGYVVTYTEKKESAKFAGSLVRVGDAKILDLVLLDSDDAFQVPVHMLARVWADGSTLRWIYLDSKWLRAQLGTLPSQVSGKRTLLTAPPEALRSFVMNYGADGLAYEGDPMVLTRTSPGQVF